MEEDTDVKDFIKMEIDFDEEDIIDACLDIEDEEVDMLLMLKPIVYTTKLEDMHIVKRDLREFNTKEITKMLIAESKPKLMPKNIKRPHNTADIQSYIKLSGVVQQLNLKAKIQAHSIYVRNLKLWNQCKPFKIVLEDIKNTFLRKQNTPAINRISNVSHSNPAIIVSPLGVSEVEIKVEAMDTSDNETVEVQIKKEVDIDIPSWGEIRTVVRHIKTEVIEISDSDTSETLLGSEENLAIPPAKTLKTCAPQQKYEKIKSATKKTILNTNKRKINNSQATILPPSNNLKTIEPHHNDEIESSSKKTKTIVDTIKNTKVHNAGKRARTVGRPRTTDPACSDDEDDTALINLKKKPVAVVTTPQSMIEKYALIVLVRKKEQAFVYRLNPTKLITDYFITKKYDEYKLAAMYPKEEKIIEQYCCWFKREEAVTKICTRKSYSFTIQKFLRVPHSCPPGGCKCCCSISNASKETEKMQERKRVVVKKSLTIADSWIRGLLDRHQSNNNSLVGKALNYIPKAHVTEKPIAKESEKYLEFGILWIKYTGVCDNFKNIPELYEIGKNGDVVRSFVIDNQEKCKHLRKTYLLMGLETLETEFCCWYTRDKLMADLRAAKVSPTALKLVQVSHICERNNCKCCCKPQIKHLRAVETLPGTLKHTTAYEKRVRPLTIRFNVRSKSAAKKVISYSNHKLNKIQKTTDTSTDIVSSPAEKADKDDLSTTILSKFKNLKLGVNTAGKLEVVLKAPARNLSIAELKVLSDILGFSTKQIAELGISPEDFCDRINSKSDQANDDVVAESCQISESEIASPEIEAQEAESSKVAPPESLLQEITQPKKQTRVSSVATLNSDPSKAISNMYASMTNLMEKKNKSFVDSFKSFFKNIASSNVVVPETNKFPPIVYGRKTPSTQQPVSLKISETFSLAKSSVEVPLIVTAGPSGAAPGSGLSKDDNDPVEPSTSSFTPIVVSTASLKTHNTRSTAGTIKRKISYDYEPTDKKIRVKSPSELMAKTIEVPITTDTTNSQNILPMWPNPIVIKREPQTNIQTIVNSTQSVPIKINPNVHKNSPSSDIIVSTTALNTVYQVNGNGLLTNTITTAAGTAKNNPGMRVLTLTPITNANNNTINKSMLAQILKKPQVHPGSVTSGSCLPPLVPIKIAPKPTPKLMSQPRTNGPNSTNNTTVKEEDPEF